MAKKKASTPKVISNRRARTDYTLDDGFVVGIQLTGQETKALRMGHGNLRGAYVTFKDNELWLLNATITGGNNFQLSEQEQVRTRKLLAKRREIEQLASARQQGLSIIPLEILTGGRYIKLRISTGKGKRKYDKRDTIKKRDLKRESDRAASRL